MNTEPDRIWSLFPGKWRHLFAKRGNEARGMAIRTPGGLAGWMKWANTEGWNAYIGMNESRTPGGVRAHTGQIANLQTLCFDIDPLGDLATPDAAGTLVLQLLHNNDVKMDWLSLVFTGRGYQIWLHLDPLPVTYHPRCAAFIRRISREFGRSYGCIIDTSVTGLAGVVRLPGTLNTKSGERACFVDSPPGIHARAPRSWVETLPEPEPLPRVPALPPHRLSAGWIFTYLPEDAIKFITEGVDVERHKVCYTLLISLREAGVDVEVAREYAEKGCTLSHLDDTHYLERTLHQIFKE